MGSSVNVDAVGVPTEGPSGPSLTYGIGWMRRASPRRGRAKGPRARADPTTVTRRTTTHALCATRRVGGPAPPLGWCEGPSVESRARHDGGPADAPRGAGAPAAHRPRLSGHPSRVGREHGGSPATQGTPRSPTHLRSAGRRRRGEGIPPSTARLRPVGTREPGCPRRALQPPSAPTSGSGHGAGLRDPETNPGRQALGPRGRGHVSPMSGLPTDPWTRSRRP